VNLAHLEPKRRPVFPLDYFKEKEKEAGTLRTKKRSKTGKRRTLVTATQGLSLSLEDNGNEDNAEIDDGNVYVDDSDDPDGSGSADEEIDKTPVLNGREEVEPPGLEGWKIDIGETEKREDGAAEDQRRERASPRLMNCALGMGGRVIVGVGSGSSLWVWNLNLKG
jgi:hypothetical protein